MADAAIQKNSIILVTGNKHKLREIQQLLGDSIEVTSCAIDLPEYQGEIDDIASRKCLAALEKLPTESAQRHAGIVTEDTSLCYHALGGMPGPYVRWFLEKAGAQGLATMLAGFENKRASAITTLAYLAPGSTKPMLFKGVTEGIIVSKDMGSSGFGWDSIFMPDDGEGATYAQMSAERKNAVSHRSKAVALLRQHLQK